MLKKRSGATRKGKPGFLATIKGLHKYSKTLADGTRRWYYKVSREKGAPIFWQTDAMPEPEPFGEPFQRAYQAAKTRWLASRQGRAIPGTIAALHAPWIQSLRLKNRSRGTIAEYERSLVPVKAKFGEDPLIMFTSPKTRKLIKDWHRTFAQTPRAADYHLSTLVSLLNYAIDEGEIAHHVAGGIAGFYEANRSDIIVEPDELEAALSVLPELAGLGVRFGAHSGFRLGDCVRVPRNTRKGQEIIWATNKSRGMQDYCVPITDAMEQVLDELEFHRAKMDAPPMTMLFSSRGAPWTTRGLSRSLTHAFKEVGVTGKSFHDLRGTAATNYKLAGFPNEDIAEFLGWKLETVKQIIKRYVGREALVQSRVIRLNANKKRSNL